MQTFRHAVNARQRRFCEAVAEGIPAGRAYERAGYHARGRTANAAASRLLNEDAVFSYLSELRSARFAGANKTDPSDDRIDAPEGITPRQKSFCELIAAGRTARQAYRQAGYRAHGNAADVQASKLLRRPRVAAYLAALQAQESRKAAMKREDLIAYLWAVVLTPVSQVTPDSPLVQSYEIRTDKAGRVVRIRIVMVSKLQALKQLADLMGWIAR